MPRSYARHCVAREKLSSQTLKLQRFCTIHTYMPFSTFCQISLLSSKYFECIMTQIFQVFLNQDFYLMMKIQHQGSSLLILIQNGYETKPFLTHIKKKVLNIHKSSEAVLKLDFIFPNFAAFAVEAKPFTNSSKFLFAAETQLLIRRKQWKSEFVIKRTL